MVPGMDPSPHTGVVVALKLTTVSRPLHVILNDLPTRPLAPGDRLVIETETGVVLATVASASRASVGRALPMQNGLRVVRLATPEDIALRRRQQEREIEAFRVGVMKIRERGLPMKLTRVEQLFDGSRLIFHFTSDGRVDFRDLVRELASEFRTRIEMRQIGVRDEAKLLGGYGSCGRPLCCTTWLAGFEPISIKMAKQQDLSLNPAKLSGLCGRLKCCLRYELPAGCLRSPRPIRDEPVDEAAPGDGTGAK